jgi:nitrate reductase gamma subunit
MVRLPIHFISSVLIPTFSFSSAYSFLDPHKEHAFLAVYIVGILIAACIIFVLVRLCCVLRERLLASRVDSISSPPEAIDDWQDLERPSSAYAA